MQNTNMEDTIDIDLQEIFGLCRCSVKFKPRRAKYTQSTNRKFCALYISVYI